MEIGLVGLGKMGLAVGRKLSAAGHRMYGWDRSDVAKSAAAAGVRLAPDLPSLFASLGLPRVLLILVPASAVDEVLGNLLPLSSRDDLLAECGNSFFEETPRRAAVVGERGVTLLDIGISGGPGGGDVGFSLMCGGEKSAYDRLVPILETLAAPSGAYGYCGPSGAGHFVKMVHNGIEYGMMESLAEGIDLLAHGPYPNLELDNVSRLWAGGSVIRSYLVDLLADILATEDLATVRGHVEATGEGQWTVETAKKLGIAVPAISAAVSRRAESAQRELYAAKILALLRARFGGHTVARRTP